MTALRTGSLPLPLLPLLPLLLPSSSPGVPGRRPLLLLPVDDDDDVPLSLSLPLLLLLPVLPGAGTDGGDHEGDERGEETRSGGGDAERPGRLLEDNAKAERRRPGGAQGGEEGTTRGQYSRR